MNTSALSILFFGFFLGLKHAVEADHLAAVTTIVTDRKSLWSSAIIGGIWGLGHTISLTAVGILVLLLNFEVSESTEKKLELAVGVMLVLLGLNVIQKIVRGGRMHFHTHDHDGHEHVHPHVHTHEDEHGHTHANVPETAHTHESKSFSPRALIIGMVHGLAGSAALMLLVIPTIDSRALGLLYIIIFGIGSIGGMMIMSLLVSLPLRFTAVRFKAVNVMLRVFAGLFSVGLGIWVIYENAFAEAA